jgi:hypothetical protein
MSSLTSEASPGCVTIRAALERKVQTTAHNLREQRCRGAGRNEEVFGRVSVRIACRKRGEQPLRGRVVHCEAREKTL